MAVACSAFLADRYRRIAGVDVVPLPLPIDPADVVADPREPVCVTMINPTPEKGLMFHATLAEELGTRRPDVPLLTVAGRGGADQLIAAGLAGGFDLRRHASLMSSPGTRRPRHIFAVTRILLVPSVWDEPAGRVAVEALLNGVPPIVSDRGGLPEVCRGGGFVLPLPPALTPQTRRPVPADDVRPWVELIERLVDDAVFYDTAQARARQAAAHYGLEAVADAFDGLFSRVAATASVV